MILDHESLKLSWWRWFHGDGWNIIGRHLKAYVATIYSTVPFFSFEIVWNICNPASSWFRQSRVVPPKKQLQYIIKLIGLRNILNTFHPFWMGFVMGDVCARPLFVGNSPSTKASPHKFRAAIFESCGSFSRFRLRPHRTAQFSSTWQFCWMVLVSNGFGFYMLNCF